MKTYLDEVGVDNKIEKIYDMNKHFNDIIKIDVKSDDELWNEAHDEFYNRYDGLDIKNCFPPEKRGY